MLEQMLRKENTREIMHVIANGFYAHPHTRHDDTFHRSNTHKDDTTYTTVVKHPQSETFLLIEKTEAGIIRVVSNAGENHSEMFKIGLAQLESEMPAIKVKTKRSQSKPKADPKDKDADVLEGNGGKAVKKPRKPKATK